MSFGVFIEAQNLLLTWNGADAKPDAVDLLVVFHNIKGTTECSVSLSPRALSMPNLTSVFVKKLRPAEPSFSFS